MYVMFQLRPFTVHNVFPCFMDQIKLLLLLLHPKCLTYQNNKKENIIQLIKSHDPRLLTNTQLFYQSNQFNCAFYQSKGLVDWSLDTWAYEAA